MDLAKHGLKTYTPDVRVLSLSPTASNLVLYGDHGKSQQEIAQVLAEGCRELRRISEAPWLASAKLSSLLLTMTPPDLDDPAAGNLWELLKAGRKLRGLGEKDLYRAVALGADGGGRSGRRVVRHRTAARHHRRAGNLRNVPRPVVRGLERDVCSSALCRMAIPPAPRPTSVGGTGALTAAMAAQRKLPARRFAPHAKSRASR